MGSFFDKFYYSTRVGYFRPISTQILGTYFYMATKKIILNMYNVQRPINFLKIKNGWCGTDQSEIVARAKNTARINHQHDRAFFHHLDFD